MNTFKKNESRLSTPERVKKGYRALATAPLLIGCCTMTAFAADDPLTGIGNLIFVLILLGWGIVQGGTCPLSQPFI